MDEKPKRPIAAQSIVMLLVGTLVGFAAGYFAAGGGRPGGSGAKPGAAAEAPTGDRLADLTKAVARDPENPELLMDLGNLYYDREDWDKAITMYEKARRKAPKNANLLSDLGSAHRNRGEFDLAVAYFQKARESDSNHWQSLLNRVLVEAFDRKDGKEAQRAFDDLKQRFPEIPQFDKIQAQISSLRAGT
jgi:tetratricopeptide (TPR) repeat protein